MLGTARIGIHDDFFQHGGHSLLAIRLLARIENELGVKLPISDFFRAGTIEQMAAVSGGPRDRSARRPGLARRQSSTRS